MRVVSQKYLDSLSHDYDVKIDVTYASGRTHPAPLTFDDLLSFSYVANGINSDELEVGCVAAQQVKFSIDNLSEEWDDISFVGATFNYSINVKLDDGSVENIQIGKFNIESSPKVEGAVNVTATDDMKKMDVKFKGIEVPCTVAQLAQKACNQVGLELATTEFTNSNANILGMHDVTSLSCRTVLSLCCEIAGSFAILNSENKVEMRWFNTNQVRASLSNSDCFEMEIDDDNALVNGVKMDFNGSTYSVFDETKAISLTPDSKILRDALPSDIMSILENIYNDRIYNLSYSPGKIKSVGNPLIEVGDSIEVVDRKGKRKKIVVGSLSFADNFSMEIESPYTKFSSETSSFTESGSIDRNLNSEVSTLYGVSPDTVFLPVPETDFVKDIILVEIPFQAQSGALPMAYFTSCVKVNGPGTITFKLWLDGNLIAIFPHYFSENVTCDKTVSITYPLINLDNGGHKVNLTVTSDDFIGEIYDGRTIFTISGQHLNENNSWDGRIAVSDKVGKHSSNPVWAVSEFTDKVEFSNPPRGDDDYSHTFPAFSSFPVYANFKGMVAVFGLPYGDPEIEQLTNYSYKLTFSQSVIPSEGEEYLGLSTKGNFGVQVTPLEFTAIIGEDHKTVEIIVNENLAQFTSVDFTYTKSDGNVVIGLTHEPIDDINISFIPRDMEVES